MKKGFLLLLMCISFFVARAQNEIMLHLSPRLGSASFSLNQAVTHPGGTYQMKYTRFEYYISEIKITHDGGQVTPCADLTLLVRPALDSMYSLGQMPGITNVEAITFSVGVPQASNHLDPALYPANHPLAPQNPSMHWGWSAGYRFAALEGDAGANLAQHFEIHALGDANYKTQTIATIAEQTAPDVKTIHLIADYLQAAKSINLSTGPIVHGSSGAAVTTLNNFKNFVFTAMMMSDVFEPSFTGTFTVSPNPVVANQSPQVGFSLPEGYEYELTVSDVAGKIITRQPLAVGDNQSLLLEKMPETGIFFVHLWQNNRPVAVEKLVFLR